MNLINHKWYPCRHPDHSSRPVFREISLAFLVKKDIILHIPEEALETHKQAGVLGAPIEAGDKMYEDLQKTYLERINFRSVQVQLKQ